MGLILRSLGISSRLMVLKESTNALIGGQLKTQGLARSLNRCWIYPVSACNVFIFDKYFHFKIIKAAISDCLYPEVNASHLYHTILILLCHIKISLPISKYPPA